MSLALAEPVEQPSGVLRAAGCLACHDAGSAAGVGPPLGALQPPPGSGDPVWVLEVPAGGGAPVRVKVDEVHLRLALTEPDALVREGYPAGLMPPVRPEATGPLLAALTSLRPDVARASGSVAGVGLSAVAFVLGHLVLSAGPIRAALVRRLTLNGFMVFYSVVISAAFGALLWTWAHAPFVPLWTPAPWTRFVPLLVMPLVTIAQVAGYSTPSPTLSGSDNLLDMVVAPVGIHRITRHPVNVSASIWALSHMFPNGDVASLCLFGSIAVLGILGSAHLDRRLAATHGEAWTRYAGQTSLAPFVAILRGRTRLVLGEIGWLRLGVGLGLYAVLLAVHTWIVGASPLPTGW